MYLTTVDPIHSTSSAMHTYHHVTSGSVEIPLLTITDNSSFIGKEPVSWGRSTPNNATSSEISYTEQGITPFANVLQGHTTVVLVCCTFEWEPHITCKWEESDTNVTTLIYSNLFCTYSMSQWRQLLHTCEWYLWSQKQIFLLLLQPPTKCPFAFSVSQMVFLLLYYTSVMIYHHRASLSEQHTDLLICHCTKQDLSRASRYVDKFSPEIARYHICMPTARAATLSVATYAFTLKSWHELNIWRL